MSRYVIGLLALLLAGPAFATEEAPSEAKVREIAKELRCAVCQNQSIYESNSDLAKDMLKIVREKVESGTDREEIRRYFLERYGDYIYLEPRKGGRNLIIWAGPFILLLLGGWALMASLKKWSGTKKVAQAPEVKVSAADHDRIKKEMERYDL